MAKKNAKAQDEIEFQETKDMTTAEQEADDVIETEDREGESLQLMVGVSAPKRSRASGSGRTRKFNPFDEHIESLYESGEWTGIQFSSDEEYKNLVNQLKNSVAYANNQLGEDTPGYGLSQGVDANEPNVLKFKISDKGERRGRKLGSKKVDGVFYTPEELDENGNPTEEARAARAARAGS